MSHVGTKIGSLGQILEKKPCVHSRGHIFRMFVMIKSRTRLKIGHVGYKTRSLGQIFEKPYVCSRGHIFSPIIMKLDHYVSLGGISNEFENGSCRVKN